MTFENLLGMGNETLGVFSVGALAALIAVGMFLAVVLAVGLYVYYAMAWMTIAKKMKYKHPWLAWVPVANIAMILQIGGFHWAWIFIALVPFLGWLALLVLFVIANWRIFEKRKYPGWFSLSLVIPKVGGLLYLIAIGFVAWSKKKR